MTVHPPAHTLEFGVILGDVPVTVDERTHFDMVLRQVEAAQRNGFTYICMGQHFLYDAYRWLQPALVMARLAGEVDAHVRLVPSVIIVPLYHPVLLAEELATLDVVTDGRLIVGVGAGYQEDEFRYFGIPFAERYARFEEGLGLVFELWQRDRVDHDGRFWQLHDAVPQVRPVQRPRPPIWMGAMQHVGIRRAARLGDTWFIPPEMSFRDIATNIAVFEAERAANGLPTNRFPLRREIIVGDTRDDAMATYQSRTHSRYQAYVARGHAVLGGQGMDDEFRRWALDRAFVGSADDCIDQLRGFDPARFGPFVVRPAWPGMSIDDTVAVLDDLGRRVVGPLSQR